MENALGKTAGTDDVSVACHALAQHATFDASDRLKCLLKYLGDRSQNPETKITQSEIAQSVMDLGPDFDPQIDAHVRIEVGRLRKALELHYARHGDSSGARVVIPKGSYCPKIQIPVGHTASTAATVSGLHDASSAAVKVFTGLCVEKEAPLEIIEMAEITAAEIRSHCFASPLVDSGLMRLPIHTDVPYERCLDLARTAGAGLSVSVRIHQNELEYRVLIELREVETTDVLTCERQVFSSSQPKSTVIRRIARYVARFLADPMLGTAPGFAANFYHSDDLKTVLAAYKFMATQQLLVLPTTLAGLERLARKPDVSATVKGLFAELSRVSGRTAQTQGSRATSRYLEMAEEALAADTSNVTCRIALGYARLDAGLIEASLVSAQSTLEAQAPISLQHKARVLVALADTEGRCHHLLQDDPLDDTTFFHMKDLSRIIPMIRWGDIDEAERLLSNSLHTNIFWLHVFHTAVLVEAGSRSRAERSLEMISRQVPDVEAVLPKLCRSFFPKENEYEYLIKGLRTAGLRV